MKKIISISILFIIICISLIGCNHNPDSNNSTGSTESTITEPSDTQEETTSNFPKLKIILVLFFKTLIYFHIGLY